MKGLAVKSTVESLLDMASCYHVRTAVLAHSLAAAQYSFDDLSCL